MHKLAVVTDIAKDNSSAIVSLLVTPSCMNCPRNCGMTGKQFSVKNLRNWNLEKGAFVKIDYSGITKKITGLISLFFPILTAFMGYFLRNLLSSSFNFELTEIRTFILTLSFMAIGFCFVKIISRAALRIARPEIIQVL